MSEKGKQYIQSYITYSTTYCEKGDGYAEDKYLRHREYVYQAPKLFQLIHSIIDEWSPKAPENEVLIDLIRRFDALNVPTDLY